MKAKEIYNVCDQILELVRDVEERIQDQVITPFAIDVPISNRTSFGISADALPTSIRAGVKRLGEHVGAPWRLCIAIEGAEFKPISDVSLRGKLLSVFVIEPVLVEINKRHLDLSNIAQRACITLKDKLKGLLP